MATKNYRYLKDGSKNPNYKPTSSSAKKATSSTTSKKKTYKYDSKGRKITNSVAPAVDRNPTEEKEKKQLPLLATWGNAVKDFLSGGKKGEKDAGRNLSPTANGRKIGEAFDAQFTDEYFESNPEYQRWIDTDINTGAARDVGNMVDVLRRRQAGFNYRSQTESPDSRYKKGDELYAINNDFNKGITDNWLASFLDKASEDDLRWAIDDWEKKIAEAPLGSEYRTRTRADLDAVKDYAKKNFSSFANEEMNRIGGEMAKLNIAKKHASVSYDSDLLAEVNAALEAGRTGYNLYDYVGNRSDLREAVGFDELEAQYEDPDDFTDALRTKLETIAGAETAMQNKTNTDVLGYQQQLEALDKDMQAAQGVRDDLLTAEKYQEMLGASWVPGAADRYNPEDYQWYSQDGERTQYNLPTLMQIMEDPEGAKQQYEQARAAGAGSGMAETFGLVGMMTEEERQLYKALAVTEGEESAQAYFEHLQPELYERETAAHVEEREAFAAQNPILASAASVPEKFLGTLGMTADMIAGREGQNQFADISQAERATVEQQISEATPWAVVNGTNLVGAAYQGAMSYIDSLFGRAVTGVMGGGNVTGDVLLGLGSATEAYSSAYDATDGDVGKALVYGLAAGALEAGAEHMSWGKWSNTGNLDSVTNALKYIVAAGAAEGGEEVISGLGSTLILEPAILKGDSELSQKYKDYTSNGYTGVQAVGRIAKELGWETTLEFFIGSLMGGTAASVNAGLQVTQQAAEDRSLGRQIQDKGNAAAVIRAALESADANIRALGERLASKIQETGLPQDAETAAEIQVAAEAVGLDANGQKVEAPALEIKQPEAEAVAAQQPVQEAAPVVEEEPAEPITEEIGTSSGAEEKPELEWREQTAVDAAPAEETAPTEETAPEKVSPEQAKKAVTEIFKGSTRKLGKLYRKMMGALDVEINTKSVEEIKTAVQNRLKQLGEDVIDPVATAIAKLASGEQMTSDELDLLEASTVRQGVLNEVATSLIRNGGREYLSDETVNLMEHRGALQQATTAKSIKVAQKQTAAAPARVQEMVEETVAADEEGSIQARAQMLGNDEAAKTMISMAKDVTNTRAYATAFEAAYDYGTAGIDPKVASTSKETTALTPEQFQAAYQAGVKAAAAPVRAAKTGGKVTFAGNLGSRLNEMDGNQRAGIRALQQVARVGTVNVEFFESTADESGKYSEDNGWYDPNTNTIHIDINAGRNTKTSTANFALLKVASHELTHYIKAQNASGYKALQDFVVSQLTTNGTNTFDGLVALKMKQRKDISYEVAVEEVVADGCEMMLKDSTAIQRLAQENKGLFRRIRNWLRSFIANVKRAFRGVQATSAEARLIKDLEGLQKLWDDALAQASRNVQQSAAEALHMSAETQQAIENDQAVDAEAEVKHSIRLDERFGTEAQRINQANGFISAATLKQALADRKVIRDIFLDPANRDLLKLPPDIEGDTFVSDASYGGTEENTTVCIRSMAAQALMDLISQNLGRPLTVQDTLLISQEIAGLTDRPECYYCYVATDRRAYRDFLGQYLAQRDEVVKKYKAGADKDELYTEFLGGRKSTANMRARFNMWINAVDNGIPMIDGNDLTSLENLFGEVDSLRGEILAAAAEVSGIEAGKLNIVNGSVRYAKSGKQVTATTLNALKKSNSGMAETINRYMQLTDATAYAQSASWAKKMKGYAAYNGHILNWSQKRVNDLNKHYGLRMYSFSDFSPAFILENMQMVTDAAVRGLNMLGYTKEMPFAEIFAPSGMNINISTFAYEQGGEVKEDYKQGASWERAKALREKHPNVGIVMVATSDNILEWALKQDWVDVVIPYHLVRTGTDVAEYFGYKNYTGVSADGKGLSFAEKNKGKAKKERVTSVSPVEHRNDLISYVDALERYGLTPRFAQWLNGLDDYRAGKISPKQFRDMNPNYMKLVNETRRSYADTDPVQPKFDMGAAKEAINQMIREGGYYTPVGGSVEAEFEIAGAVADKIRDSNVKYSRRMDEEYQNAYDDYDEVRAQEIIQEAAIAAGYSPLKLYHGTTSFGFTEIDPKKSDDGISFFTSSDDMVAQTYAGKDARIRRVGGKADISFDQLMNADGERLLSLLQKYVNENYEKVSMKERRAMAKEEGERIRESLIPWAMDIKNDSTNMFEEKAVVKAFDAVIDALDRMSFSNDYDVLEYRVKQYQDACNNLEEVSSQAEAIFSWTLSSDIYNVYDNMRRMLSEDVFKIDEKLSVEYTYRNQAIDMLRKKLFKGIYELYGKTDNLLEIDGKGANWNRLDGGFLLGKTYATTRDFAEYAKEMGFDGVHFKNIHDVGGLANYNAASDIYTFFNPSDVKSADPFTFDDDGNLIPSSKRFDSSRTDIRYSKRSEDSEAASIRDQIRNNRSKLNSMEAVVDTEAMLPAGTLRQDTLAWAMDMLAESGYSVYREGMGTIVFDRKRINDALKYLKKPAERAALAALPEVLKDGIEIGEHNDHKDRGHGSTTIGAPVIINGIRGNMGVVVKHTTGNFYKAHRIFMPDGSDFEFVENKNTVRGRAGGLANNGPHAQLTSTVFENSVADNDGDVKKSIRTDSLTDREILADAFENVAQNDTERSFLKNYRDKIADLQQKQEQLRAINKDITDRKAKAERKPNGRLVYDEELIKQQNRAKLLRAQIDREDNAIIEMIKSKPLQDVLRRQKKRIESIEAGKRKEAIATIRDRKNATEVRHKIKAVLDDFNRRLKNPTEKSYIPANMVQLVIAAEELIDTRSGREGEKAQAKLAALQGMYERYKSDATFAYVYDPVIADMLNSLSSVVGNKSIYQLNSAELQSVYETLKALKKQVTEAVKLKAGDYARSIIDAGREMIRETQAAAPLAKGKAGEFLNWQLTPDKFFARLAGFKKNSIWSKVAESFSKGTEKMLEIQRDHYYHFKKFTESKEFDKLNDQKHLVDIGLTNDKGETVKVTRGMMLSAYMHLINEENARGFMYGGFSIPNLKAYYDGKVKESYGRGSANTRGTAQELYELAQQMNDPSLTEEQLAALEAKHDQLIMEGMNRLEQMRNDIYSQMTQYEKDLVAAVRAWNDGKSQAYINDVTMDLYGIKKASVQNYFPIHRDTAFVNTDFASISRNVNLENWGSLKTRVPSQAPILLTDIAYEMDSSLNQMSRYVGYARAQRDFNKLYNVRMPGMSGSVKKAVSVKFGTGAGKLGVSGEQYIENYIGSITGSRQGQSGPLSLIRRNLVRSTMTLNLRVGFSQLSAIPKAAAEVGWDSMASGFMKGGLKAIFSKSDREDLAKQNAWFWQRYRGEGGQREFADAKGGNDIISKAWNKMDDITRGKLLNWCQNFDVMSTVSMWSMAKAWARKHTNYAEGSAEFIEAANKKYTDILRNTQAMSTTTERSDASRNTSDGWNLFMMFKSEAFANFNLLYDAVAKVRKYSADFKAGANGVTRADVNAAKRHLAGAATSVILGASLGNAILKLAINALMHAMNGYRDDEDEIGFESILTAIGKEVASDTTGMVLLGGELYEFISAAVMGDKYYAPTDMALGEVTELLETVMKVAQDEDRTAEDVLNAGKKVAFNLTNIFGVPAENGKRFVKMIQDWRDEFNNETPWYEFEGGVTRSNSTNYDRLYNAAIAGDNTKFEQVLAELVENGKDEKDALAEFRTRIKKAYQNGDISEADALELLVSHGGKSKDDAFWTMDEWSYEGDGNYSQYADLRTALENANASVVQTEIQKLTNHGVKEDSVIKEISKAYNNGTATNIVSLQIRSDRLFTNQAKPKGAKKEDKADPNAFDAFIAAVLSGRGLSAEIARLEAQGYKTKNFMTALNQAFGSDDNRYRKMEYYNPSDARILLDRILDAYEAIGKDRNEEIAWINENWEKFVPDTED